MATVFLPSTISVEIRAKARGAGNPSPCRTFSSAPECRGKRRSATAALSPRRTCLSTAACGNFEPKTVCARHYLCVKLCSEHLDHWKEASMQRQAACSCEKLKVDCDGEPESVSLCHCLACQKRTGSPFGVAAFFLKKNVRVHGSYNSFCRSSDFGYVLTFHFCAHCGSTVFWEPSRKPDMFAVGTGSFGDPNFPSPNKEVYTEFRHGWLEPLQP